MIKILFMLLYAKNIQGQGIIYVLSFTNVKHPWTTISFEFRFYKPALTSGIRELLQMMVRS